MKMEHQYLSKRVSTSLSRFSRPLPWKCLASQVRTAKNDRHVKIDRKWLLEITKLTQEVRSNMTIILLKWW